jgi:peptidoglycan hydrolase-like protein with peptidoglycan-binding domain
MASDPKPWPIIRTSDTGTAVRALEHLLRLHGADLEADGLFGPDTEAAVKGFQAANDLDDDGLAGPKTLAALVVLVRPGDKDDKAEAVTAAQVLVEADDVDGIFGPKTETAVKYWQDKLDLGIDGIVGPKTWQALFATAAD